MKVSDYFGHSGGDTERLDSGKGQVFERTLLIGQTVIVLENIGTMRIIDGKKNHLLAVFGAVVTLLGLALFGDSKLLALLLIIAGVALIAQNLGQKIDMFLELATSDGKSTIIISKDRKFLQDVRSFLQQKIDTRSTNGATINISNSTLDGVFAMGDGARAHHAPSGVPV